MYSSRVDDGGGGLGGHRLDQRRFVRAEPIPPVRVQPQRPDGPVLVDQRGDQGGDQALAPRLGRVQHARVGLLVLHVHHVAGAEGLGVQQALAQQDGAFAQVLRREVGHGLDGQLVGLGVQQADVARLDVGDVHHRAGHGVQHGVEVALGGEQRGELVQGGQLLDAGVELLLLGAEPADDVGDQPQQLQRRPAGGRRRRRQAGHRLLDRLRRQLQRRGQGGHLLGSPAGRGRAVQDDPADGLVPHDDGRLRRGAGVRGHGGGVRRTGRGGIRRLGDGLAPRIVNAQRRVRCQGEDVLQLLEGSGIQIIGQRGHTKPLLPRS